MLGDRRVMQEVFFRRIHPPRWQPVHTHRPSRGFWEFRLGQQDRRTEASSQSYNTAAWKIYLESSLFLAIHHNARMLMTCEVICRLPIQTSICTPDLV